jgi:hypothetical protein
MTDRKDLLEYAVRLYVRAEATLIQHPEEKEPTDDQERAVRSLAKHIKALSEMIIDFLRKEDRIPDWEIKERVAWEIERLDAIVKQFKEENWQ